VGGENYHTQFDTYAFHRGQENDCWLSKTVTPEEPEHYGLWSAQYEMNREAFETSADFPTPKTFNGAIEWLKRNEGADDYLLWVEGFDPHEPFDCPQGYLDIYGDKWDGPRNHWTGYDCTSAYSDEALTHLRRQYAGTLTMADEYIGKLFDEMERQGTFEETLIILTTDHGHLIGEHGLSGKNFWHVWNELGNIPLIVKLPGNLNAGERRGQLTQNIDVMPTLLDFFKVNFSHPIHGESLKGVLEKNAPVRRQAAIYGWFGMTVNVTDGRYTYFRAAAREENDPLFAHYQIPTTYHYHDVLPIFFQNLEVGQFLPWTDQPVFRCKVNYMTRWSAVKETQLFNIKDDPGQEKNLAGMEIENKYIELLKETMKKMDAPTSQFERLGL
jgi:arylsulfatase A-like enzyme